MPQISGTMHLAIIKGVAKVPQDNNSAEIGLDPIDLLDPNGFSCDEYLMKIPTMKSSAIYADSPLTDGRTLISGTLGNVTETIRLTLNASTIIQMAALLSKLGRMKQDCNDFWDTFGQIEPVYIKHQVDGEPGPRYALLYDIDIDVEAPIDPSQSMRTVTLSIEREYGWRGIKPGGNPREWTLGNQFNATGTTPVIGNNRSLIFQSVNNVNEFSTVNRQTVVTKNYIDIDGDLVPGDLPALCLIKAAYINASPAGPWQIFVSRKSVPSGQLVAGSNLFTQSTMLNAGDMTLGANTALAADTGAPLTQSGGVRRRAEFTPASGTDAVRLTLANRSISNHRGRYAVFVRCRQAAGAANDIAMHLVYGQNSAPVFMRVATPSVNPVLQAGTGNTVNWPVSYMGVITVPIATNSLQGSGGRGVQYASDFIIELWAQRVAGVTATLYIADIVLLPIDEPSNGIVSVSSLTEWDGYFDGTGYFTHGKPDYFVTGQGDGSAATSAAEGRGQSIELLPKTDQRLYFFSMSTTNLSNIVTEGANIGIDIVPRWSGLRDA